MKCPNLKKENIIKDVRNIFRLENLKKKETTDTTNKDIRNFFRLEKENAEIKGILRHIRNLFRLGKENKAIKNI